MPSGTVMAFVRALPRLEAWEHLTAVTVAALATGSVERRQARSILGRWEELANGDRPRPKRDVMSQLGQLGITVERVPG